MKQILKKSALALATLAIVGTGCKKNDFNINTNPNQVTESTVDYVSVLPAAQAQTARIVATDWKFLQNYLGFWARSGSFQGDGSEENYSFTRDFNVAIWNDLYSNATNYEFIRQKANANGAGIYEAIARIMKANDFQMLVDVYGNVPYSQALKGAENITPQYDNGEAIYKDLLLELDAAIALLKNTAVNSVDVNPGIAANDLVFQGSTTNWIKYANTLKLRLLMHVCNTTFVGETTTNGKLASFDVATEVANIVAEGTGFLGAGQTAAINPGFTDVKPNPFYRFYVKNENGVEAGNYSFVKANFYAVGGGGTPGYYQYNGDLRVNRFYSFPTGLTTHRGIPYGEPAGLNPANIGANLSYIAGPGLLPNGSGSRAWLLTSVESLFLQAEAAERGFLTTNTSDVLLRQAITESFTSLGLTAANATSYINNNATYSDVDIAGVAGEYVPGTPGGGMYTIMSQKWFALNSIATLEVWTDYRRTDIPYGVSSDFTQGPPLSVSPGVSTTKLPIRLFYPQSEASYNAANLPTGIDVFNSKIFWDIN